jgi:NitT/TauT family transport system substrate-binding protein
MTGRLRTAWVVVVALAFLGAACAHSTAQRTAALKPMKLGSTPSLSFAPFYIAKEKGFFSRQGIDLQFVNLPKSAQSLPALAKGDIDALGGGMSAALVGAIARTSGLKAVADRGRLGGSAAPCSYSAILASKRLLDSGKLHRASDLRGLKVGLNPVNVNAYLADQFLHTDGLSLKDVRVVNIEGSLLPKALQSGAVDVAATSEPWLTTVQEAGAGRIWKRNEDLVPGGGSQNGVLIFGSRLAKDDQTDGERFMVAYLQGVREYSKGKTPSNVASIAKYTSLQPDFLRKACWPVFESSGRINWPDVDGFQRWAKSRGLIDRTLAESEFLTSTFVDRATRLLGS